MIQHELAPSFSENLRVGLDEISKTFGMAHEIDPVESLVGRLPPPFVNLEELSGEATVATRPESIGAWET